MSSNKQPLISIIVPVYNGEKYLPFLFKSLDSLLFKQYEIAFIDDGSKDNSLKMLQDYCKKEKRAKVYHITNHGLPFARNYGVSKTKGKYVYFLDCDDSFHPSILTALLYGLQSTNSDVSICGYKTNFRRKKTWFRKKKEKVTFETIVGSDNILWAFFSQINRRIHVWDKLYKRSLLQKIKKYPFVFDKELLCAEDAEFNLKYLALCHKLCFTKKRLFSYRMSLKSTNSHPRTKKQIDTIKKCIMAVEKFNLNNMGAQKRESVNVLLFYLAQNYLFAAINSKVNIPKKDILYAYKTFQKTKKTLIHYPNLPLSVRMMALSWLWIRPRLHLKNKK